MKITVIDEVEFDGKVVKALIDRVAATATLAKAKYTTYKGAVSILDRKFDDETLKNNKLPNDFRGEIVDSITAYLIGKPITYSVKDAGDTLVKTLTDYKKRNNIHAMDVELVKLMACCGEAGRLLYLDDGNIRVQNLENWKYITIWKEDILYAVIYYYRNIRVDGVEYITAEVYDRKNVTVWMEKDSAYEILVAEKDHGFAEVPFIPVLNNKESLGDFDKVDDLIDAYDKTVSDMQNEVEEHRVAYQVFKNCKVDAKVKEQARLTGAFNIPKGGEVKYLVKEINAEFINKHLDRLEENIYRFSKTVNMSDEKFSGDTQSGVSRKWKLLHLEFRATIKQLSLIEGLMEQFRIMEYIWKAKGLKFEYLDVEMSFTRNIPMELKEAAETGEKLSLLTSRRTVLETLPNVPDVDEELKRIDAETDDELE